MGRADLPPPPSATVRRVALVLVAVGLFLRWWQYSADTALWLDEIAVARNVLERPLSRLLLEPLDYDQTAPKGFLLAEFTATRIAGSSESALRAWPWLASMASVLLFWRLSSRVVPGLGGGAALLCFALAGPLIRQSGEVKQYTTDVAATVLLMLLGLPTSRARDRIAGALGALAIWFSQPAAIVAGAIAGVLALDGFARAGWRGLDDRRWRLGLWIGSAALSVAVARTSMTAATSAYMKEFWTSGFPPLSASTLLRSGWPWVPLQELFGSGPPAFQNSLFYPAAWLYTSLALLGLLLLVRRGREGWIVVAPVVATAAAALVQQYPFRDRVILFLLPSLFLGVGAAVEAFVRPLARVNWFAGVVLLLSFAAGVITPLVTVSPPYTIEDVKPVMAEIGKVASPGTAIYVHANAAPAFDYYAPAFDLERSAYTVGSCHFTSGQELLREVDRYRGKRDVWVVTTHLTTGIVGQQGDLLRYFDAIGRRRRSISVESRRMGEFPLPAEAFQYDLSDPQRLQEAKADSFPVHGNYSRTRPACEQGPIRMATVSRQP